MRVAAFSDQIIPFALKSDDRVFAHSSLDFLEPQAKPVLLLLNGRFAIHFHAIAEHFSEFRSAVLNELTQIGLDVLPKPPSGDDSARVLRAITCRQLIRKRRPKFAAR